MIEEAEEEDSAGSVGHRQQIEATAAPAVAAGIDQPQGSRKLLGSGLRRVALLEGREIAARMLGASMRRRKPRGGINIGIYLNFSGQDS